MKSHVTMPPAWMLPFVLLIVLILVRSPRPSPPAEPPTTSGLPRSPGPTDIDTDPITSFDAWAADADPAADTARGIILARERRTALKKLIQFDPEAAIAHAVPYAARRRLPPEVVRLLEIPVSTNADFTVEIACGLPGGGSRREQWTTIKDQRLQIFTYGERAEITSKDKLSIHGIAIDGVMAMLDDPLREWSPEERTDYGHSRRIAQLGDRLFAFDSDHALATARERLRLSEQTLGPHSLEAYREIALGGIAGLSPVAMQNGTSTSEDLDLPTIAFSQWTEGVKNMLYIRARFANEGPGSEPLDLATAQSRQSAAEAFWFDNSYGKSSLSTTYTSVVTLPSAATTYVGNFNLLLTHARQAAAAANSSWNSIHFNFYTVITTGTPGTFGYTGAAELGGKGSHLLSNFTTNRTASHEFGHNLGLNHSEYWLTDSPSPIGPDSNPGGYVGDSNDDERIEYGHKFAIMGSQDNSGDFENGLAHFTASDKNRLDWLEQAGGDIISTTSSGTIRLYRHDVPSSQLSNMTPGVARAIKIDLNATDPTGLANPYRYWLSYRFLPSDGIAQDWLRNGLQVDWRRDGGGFRSVMLDMTPYTRDTGPYLSGPAYAFDNNDKEDGVLVLGRTFSDTGSDIHFTPIARGGGAPNQWLDVVVNIGTQDQNTAPTIINLTVSKPNPAVGETITLSTTATDIDGDALAYHWDVGDNSLQPGQFNNPTQTKSWSSPGYYLIRCEVSDMKGGKALATRVITVGRPYNNGTWGNANGGSWSTSTNWNAAQIAGGADNTADFSTLNLTSNATVTLDAPRAIGNLVFGDTNTTSTATWLLNNGTNGSLTLSSPNPTITVNPLGAGSFANIGARLSGFDGFIKNGMGNLILNNPNNTLTGHVTINQGNIQLNSASLTQATGITLNGGALVIATSTANAAGGTITFNGGTLQFNQLPGSDYSTQFSTAAAQAYRINVVGNTEVTLATNLSSPGGTLTKLGPGTLVLGKSNSYSGGTTLTAGTLRYANTTALGTGSVAVNNNSTSLQAGVAATLPNDISIPTGISATLDTNGHNTTLAGDITGSGSLSKISTGTLTLTSGMNTTLSGGIHVDSGRLDVLNGLALTNAPGPVTIASGATFNYSRNFLNGNDLGNPLTISGTGTGGFGALNLRGNVTATGDITIAADATISHDFNNATISGSITGNHRNLTLATLTAGQPGMSVSGSITLGTGGITIQGAANTGNSSVRLSGNNNYTGETHIASGSLMLTGASRIADSASLRIASGAMVHLDFNGIDIVGALILNDTVMPNGSYGSPLSAAGNKSAFFGGTGIIQVGPSNYETWTILQNVPGAAFEDDFNSDGITNGMAYALGLSPTASNQIAGTLAGHTVTFPKGTEAMANADVMWTIQVSDTLKPGSWNDAITQAPGDSSPTIQLDLDPGSGTARKFARLRVVRVP